MKPRVLVWLMTFSVLGFGPVAEAQETAPAARSREFSVQPTDLWQNLIFTGEVQAARSLDLTVPRTSASFNNLITYMPLEGTKVNRGEPLLEFDQSVLLAQLEEGARRLDEAKLRIEKQKADLEAQRQDLMIDLTTQQTNVEVAKLYAGIEKELLPSNQYQKYQVDLERAQLALQKSKERLANFEATYATQMSLVEIERSQAEIDYKKVENDLKLLKIDAPQEGVVVYGDNWANNRKVQIGDNLFSGQTVMSLPDLSELLIVANVYDMEIQRLKAGMPAQVSVDAIPGRSWKGQIKSITSIGIRKGLTSKHKVFKATVSFDQADNKIMKPGMTARIEVPQLSAQKVLAIPREYLKMEGNDSYWVYKALPSGGQEKGGTKSPVKIGIASARMVEITEGVKAGEVLVPPTN